jgi:alpha-D-ribose 1-methylphosphonate 5-triphosphate synthase subunit PhnG
MALADDLLSLHGEPVIVTAPEVVLVALDVREPVCAERFRIGDVLATRAEVAYGGHEGWAVRMGDDRAAALAAAICSAVGDHSLEGSERVDDLCRATESTRTDERLVEWSELLETVVEFEELD